MRPCFKAARLQRPAARFSPFVYGGLFRFLPFGEGTNPLQQKRKNNMNRVKNNPHEPKAAPMYQNQCDWSASSEQIRCSTKIAPSSRWLPRHLGKRRIRRSGKATPNGIAALPGASWPKPSSPSPRATTFKWKANFGAALTNRELPVVGGGTTIVPMTSWEIRVRTVRKLVRKKNPAQKPAKALKAAA